MAQKVKHLPTYSTGDLCSILGFERSPGEGNDNPLQYSCLETPWMEEPGRLQSMGLQRVRHFNQTQHENRIIQRCLLRRRNMSLSKIHCCYIIISTELKKKHTLEQNELFSCIIISSGLKEKMSYVTKTKECRKKIVLFSSRAQDPFLLFEGPGPHPP